VPEGDLLAGRYRLQSLLGRGAMGEVWLAHDQLLNRTVAVKRLLTGGPNDPTQTERVMREARLAGRLTHPNAVAVYDLLVSDGVPVVVMEYVTGQSLGALLRQQGHIDPDTAARIGADVAAALEAAHSAGIVHRDVKPDNVLITPHGTAKLADFGIAHAAEEAAITQTGMTVGTPAYLAPEVARGGQPRPSSDIWSLGATLFAAVDGRPPFGEPTDNALAVLTKVVGDPVPAPEYGGPLTEPIRRMLQRDPALRPTANDVHVDLLRLAGTAGVAGAAGVAADPTQIAPLLAGAAAAEAYPTALESGLGPVRPAPVGDLPSDTAYAPPGAYAPAPYGPGTGYGPAPVGYPPRRRSALVPTLILLALLVAGAVVAVAFALRDTSSPTPSTTSPALTPAVSVPITPGSTSVPPTTTAAPTTSTPPTTSAAPTTTSAPRTTSPPTTTSAPRTSTSAPPSTSANSSTGQG
jgi:hypothetical protein